MSHSDNRHGEFYPARQIRDGEAVAMAASSHGSLMRRAAFTLAVETCRELRARTGGVQGRRVLVLAGAGHNGGDALWAGVELRRRGVAVQVALTSPDRKNCAALQALTGAGGVVIDALGKTGLSAPLPDLAIDGIVGLASSGPLRSPGAELVYELQRNGTPFVAADVPSGVDPTTGHIHPGAVRAVATVAFGACQIAHALAREACGRIVLVDLGFDMASADLHQITSAEVGTHWPVPGAQDDKYSGGVAGIVAGSAKYPGAAILAATAAVQSTSSMVRYCGTSASEVVAARPEVVATASLAEAGRVQSWVIGPGIGTGVLASEMVESVLATNVPVVCDADAITILSVRPWLIERCAGRQAPLVLTPHAGEFQRLTGEDPRGDRLGAVRRYCQRLRGRGINAVVLLKGAATIIAGTESDFCLVESAEQSWAATPGSGDVLSGIIGARIAAAEAIDATFDVELAMVAVAHAARVHTVAAQLAATSDAYGQQQKTIGRPVGASEIAGSVGTAIGMLRAEARKSRARWQSIRA